MEEPEDFSTAKRMGETDETQGYLPLDLRLSSNKRRRNEDIQNDSENRKVSDFFHCRQYNLLSYTMLHYQAG